MSVTHVLNWFSGGTEHPYMRLFYCMKQDALWIGLTVTLDIAVAVGYLVIARHWWHNQRALSNSPAKRALASLRNIFLFCGICGYAFIPIKMFWPAWRLYDIFMVFLVYFTWKYAWGAKDLKIVYTELSRSEALAAELKASREDAARKGYFLNAISHDLRTPLNGLMLQAEVADIAVQEKDLATMRESIAQIKQCVTATADVLQRFLEMGRLDSLAEPAQVKPVDLAEVAEQILQVNAVAAEEAGLYLRSSGGTGLTLAVDRVKLDCVLNNLVGNALKFTEKGGVEVSISEGGAAVEIVVVDTGVGIAAEHHARLFEEFFQVKNYERDRRKGLGLGLTISRRLARSMGGDITLASAPGSGSRFILRLPRPTSRPDPGRPATGGSVARDDALAFTI